MVYQNAHSNRKNSQKRELTDNIVIDDIEITESCQTKVVRRRNTASKWQQKPNRYAEFVKKCQEEDKRNAEYWNTVSVFLADMQKEILALGTPPEYNLIKENLIYCVNLFEITSRYQDLLGGEIRVVPAEKAEVVKEFNNDLYFTGRHAKDDLRPGSDGNHYPYWNTTEMCVPITTDNIFFGPDIGLPSKPASYWLSLSKKKKVYVNEIQAYSKGFVERQKTMWATEAIVKLGVHKFIKTAYEALTRELAEMLKGENATDKE